MAAFTGTSRKDIITPETVSRGVTADPLRAKPSEAKDTILGLGGDDTLDGGAGASRIRGGAGDSNRGDGAVYGDGGDDVIWTNGEVDTVVHGGTGNDEIYGYADSGTLTIYGDGGNDWIGVSSDDGDPTCFLYGGVGDDTLKATSNFNNAPFGVGTNALLGGVGDDQYIVFQSEDEVVEEADAGTDTVLSWADFVLPDDVENLTLLFTDYIAYGNVSATGNELDNVIRGNAENNVIDGLGGNDLLYGRAEGIPATDIYGDAYEDGDVIRGGDGDDTMFGGDGLATWDGRDRLLGGAGEDTLFGQAGADTLSGGAGFDVYAFNAIDESTPLAMDSVLDFGRIGTDTGDRIDLSAIDANEARGGRQDFTFVTTALTGPGQLHVVEATSGGGSIIEGEVDGRPGVDFAVAVDDGDARAADWAEGDFIL